MKNEKPTRVLSFPEIDASNRATDASNKAWRNLKTVESALGKEAAGTYANNIANNAADKQTPETRSPIFEGGDDIPPVIGQMALHEVEIKVVGGDENPVPVQVYLQELPEQLQSRQA